MRPTARVKETKPGEAKAAQVHRTEHQRTGGQRDSSGALQRVHPELPLSIDHQCKW